MRRLFHHIFTLLAVLSLALCATTIVLWVQARAHGGDGFDLPPEKPTVTRTYQNGTVLTSGPAGQVIEPGDVVTVTLHDMQGPGTSMVTSQPVRPDGTISLPWLGPLKVASLTAAQLETAIVHAYDSRSDDRTTMDLEIAGKRKHVPYWPIAGGALILPVALTVAAVRRFRRGVVGRRRTPDLCVRCGYDLRATPERCPECGTTPVAMAGCGD